MKFHSRHQYIAETGQSISKGGWERLNRAYAVYQHRKLQVVGYDSSGKPLVRPCQTLVMLPETPKHNRKVPMRDRFMPRNKRARFPEGKQAGIVK